MIMEIFLILNHLEYKLFVFWGFYNCCYFVFVVSIVAIIIVVIIVTAIPVAKHFQTWFVSKKESGRVFLRFIRFKTNDQDANGFRILLY